MSQACVFKQSYACIMRSTTQTKSTQALAGAGRHNWFYYTQKCTIRDDRHVHIHIHAHILTAYLIDEVSHFIERSLLHTIARAHIHILTSVHMKSVGSWMDAFHSTPLQPIILMSCNVNCHVCFASICM